MTEREHCRKCGGAVDLYDDGELHHAVDLDDPNGLFELVAKEHDHPAELCAGMCEDYSRATGGLDVHKGPLAQSWEYACDELAELNPPDPCTCSPDGCDGDGYDPGDPRVCVFCRDLDGEMPCPADVTRS